jgi:2-polyprenyl-6-methoxyphenol hydroxylase-like FAD-dependent oxidoreductase
VAEALPDPSVLIVGGGPTGLMLACELGLVGIPTVLVDKSPGPRLDAPGIAINIGTAELLAQRDWLDPIRAVGTVLPAAHFALVGLDPTVRAAERENAYLVPQSAVERVLAERAVSLGAVLRRGTELVDLTQDADGVTARLRGPDGAYELRARYLVGADGPDGPVGPLAGIGASETEIPSYGLVGDLRADFAKLPAELFGVHRHPGNGGFYTGAPAGNGLLRFMTAEFGARADAAGPLETAELVAGLRRVTGAELPSAAEVVWAQRYRQRTRLAERYREGRVFLAGDAAHVFPALGGARINTGVEDAVNLSWKLSAVLRGTLPETILDTYQRERQPVAVAAADSTAAQLALGAPAPGVAQLRELFAALVGLPQVNDYLVDMVTGLDARYPEPDGTDPDSVVGTLLSPARLKTLGGGEVAEALRQGRGALTYTEPEWLDAVGATDSVCGLALVQVSDLDSPGTRLLIRPDGRVAAVDPDGTEPYRVGDALRSCFGNSCC